ncbi:heavy metal translocating P-type ATPase [Aquitalea pelogenes]|uniref:heavy metal translocating P-type ATPase n=1 Tax=Aquitalea pelogenes TaxID=1293573 RepID=UPI0009EBB24E|nr:heavy metal translocating P-type ATPase [Aquitalea pelogenes]
MAGCGDHDHNKKPVHEGGHAAGHTDKHDHNHNHAHDHDHAHSHASVKYRVSTPAASHDDHDHAGGQCCSSAPIAFGSLAAPEVVADGIRTAIRIMQMDCPTEEALIRKKLGSMPSVKSLEFNLMQRVLTVVHAPNAQEAVLEAVRSLGFQPEVPDASGRLAAAEEPKKPWWPLALAGVAAVGSEAVSWVGLPSVLTAALAILAVAACGLTTYKKGWVAIRNGNLNINALMSIAVTGALALRQWPEASMVMVLFTIAELIEVKSLDRARNAIEGLMQLAPEKATVQQADGSWQEMDAKAVTVGSVVRVKPGERIGLDGEIVLGRSSVNQAPITGESLPVDKAEGDAVFAGTINESGSFDYRVTAAASNTTLARIIHAVEEAQGAKAPTQRFVDQFARVYTPIVFAIALMVAILPPLLMSGSWHDWIYKALVLLVIACPCALVISTPVTIVSGLAAAARHGILIKGGVYLEEGRKLAWLALDKTGTLTHGKPVQTEFELRADVGAKRCRSLAASLAGRSDHPVSQAVSSAAARDGITWESVDAFEALPGRGVRGVIGGKTYSLGNHRLVHELDRCSSELEARLDGLERQGKTVVMLIDDRQVLALFAVADTVKDSSRTAIADLHQLGIKTVMLTGDNPHTAEAIAQQVGVNQTRGNQLPEDKLKAIEMFSSEGTVGMVGDGINDAPALARANIGFAMGAMGTDTAIETADVALMDDDLRKIPTFVRLSQATRSVLLQNIVLALGIKAVFLVLTLVGLGTMWMAVFADVGASLLVVGNGLRLLRK